MQDEVKSALTEMLTTAGGGVERASAELAVRGKARNIELWQARQVRGEQQKKQQTSRGKGRLK